jgi:hypothetical protein
VRILHGRRASFSLCRVPCLLTRHGHRAAPGCSGFSAAHPPPLSPALERSSVATAAKAAMANRAELTAAGAIAPPRPLLAYQTLSRPHAGPGGSRRSRSGVALHRRAAAAARSPPCARLTWPEGHGRPQVTLRVAVGAPHRRAAPPRCSTAVEPPAVGRRNRPGRFSPPPFPCRQREEEEGLSLCLLGN